MAIARINSDSAFENDVAAFLAFSYTVAAGSNLFLVSSEGQQSGLPVVSWTYDSVGITTDKEEDDPSAANNNVRIGHLVAPNVGSLTLRFEKSNATGFISLCAANYTGVKQTGQPDATASDSSASASGLSYTITTVADDCWIATVASNSTGVLNGGTNYSILEQPSTSNAAFGDSNASVGAAGGKTVSMSGNSGHWWAASASYAPAVTGPAGVKTLNGTAVASVKTFNGTNWGSIKTFNGTS